MGQEYAVIEAAHNLMESYKECGDFLALRILRSVADRPDWNSGLHIPPNVKRSTGEAKIRGLERNGLIKRDGNNGRSVFYSLTPAGRKAIESALKGMPEIGRSEQFKALLRCCAAIKARGGAK